MVKLLRERGKVVIEGVVEEGFLSNIFAMIGRMREGLVYNINSNSLVLESAHYEEGKLLETEEMREIAKDIGLRLK